MSLWLGILIGFVILMLIVTAHELGHFWAARKSKIDVEEFGIGMPPRAWAKKLKSGVVLSLNWLPIGGFCKMKGETDEDKRKGSFGAASYGGKTFTLFGGVLANLALGVVILTVLAWVGLPVMLPNQFHMGGGEIVSDNRIEVTEVQDGSPAEAAGIEVGEYIVWLGSPENTIDPWTTNMPEWTKEHAGQTVELGVLCAVCDETDVRTVVVTLNPDGAESGFYLGTVSQITGSVAPMYYARWWQAPIVGVVTTGQLTYETVKGVGELLYNLVTGVFRQVNTDETVRQEGQEALGRAGDAVTGPVGIIGVFFPAFASAGIRELSFLTALISISLAVMNVLPIPALDGGRWTLITVYKLRRKKLTAKTEEKAVGISFMILMGLFVLITVLDVMRLFR